MRCDGKGKLEVVVGYPNQDLRLIPYADIRWREPITVDPCPVCQGGGFKPVKPPRKEYVTVHVHDTDLTFEELVARLPVKEESDDRYEEGTAR